MTLCVCVSDEELIRWGWPEDVWFHVDKVSSAHVYLRLKPVSDARRDSERRGAAPMYSYDH